MLPSMLKGRPKSNEEWKEKADAYIATVNRIYEKARQDTLHDEIEKLLKEKPSRWEEQVRRLMESDEHPEAMQADYSLTILKKVYKETAVLHELESLEEVQNLYQRTVFYLRRIEMDMPDEAYEGIRDLIEERRLTPQYLLAVLNGGRIYKTLDTAYKLSGFLARSGYGNYAEQIIVWLRMQLNKGK